MKRLLLFLLLVLAWNAAAQPIIRNQFTTNAPLGSGYGVLVWTAGTPAVVNNTSTSAFLHSGGVGAPPSFSLVPGSDPTVPINNFYTTNLYATNFYASNIFATNATFTTITNTSNYFNIAKGGHLTITNDITIQTNGALILNLTTPSVLVLGTNNTVTNATLSGLTLGNNNMLTRDALTGDVTTSANVSTIANNAVTDAKFRQGVARSVVGVTGNATANTADIQGATDTVLRVNGAGTAVAFGAIDLSKSAAAGGVLQAASFPTLTGDVTTSAGALAATIANNAVTLPKLVNATVTQRVLGRNTAGSGNWEEVTASQLNDWIGSTRGSVLYRGASGWAIRAPNTAGYVLTDGGVGADPNWAAAAAGGLATSGSQYAIVGGAVSGTANWTALSNAYVTAKTATPQGAALSVQNRYTILLLPGVYDLGSSSFTLDTQFIDIMGISPNTGPLQFISGNTDYGDTIIKSSGIPMKVTANPNDLTIANLAIFTTGNNQILQYTVAASANNKILNVILGKSGANSADAMADVNYAGTYVDVRCWDRPGLFPGYGSTLSGSFFRCKAGSTSLCSGGTASGVFIECEADGQSIGKGTASGTFIRCREANIDGTSGGIMAGTFTGTAQDCYTPGGALNYSSGKIMNCNFGNVIENRAVVLKTTGGLASTDTTAAVNIAATGWTNTFSKNATVYIDGTAVTFTNYNSAGTAIYTNVTAFTGVIPVPVQSGGKVIISGTSVTGRAVPF